MEEGGGEGEMEGVTPGDEDPVEGGGFEEGEERGDALDGGELGAGRFRGGGDAGAGEGGADRVGDARAGAFDQGGDGLGRAGDGDALGEFLDRLRCFREGAAGFGFGLGGGRLGCRFGSVGGGFGLGGECLAAFGRLTFCGWRSGGGGGARDARVGFFGFALHGRVGFARFGPVETVVVGLEGGSVTLREREGLEVEIECFDEVFAKELVHVAEPVLAMRGKRR